MTDWIEQMTWQDWIDRAALREQAWARMLRDNGLRSVPSFFQLFEMAFSAKWKAEFEERLRQRKPPPDPEGGGEQYG